MRVVGAFSLGGTILLFGVIAGLIIGTLEYTGTPHGMALWGVLIPSAVAVIGVMVAIVAIIAQRHTARAQATLEHLATAAADHDLIAAKARFAKLAAEHDNLGVLAAEAHDGDDDVKFIDIHLNSYELIAIGIQRGIIDCELFRRWNRTAVVHAWRAAQPYVEAVRRRAGRPAIWHEFEQMAKSFDSDQPPTRRF